MRQIETVAHYMDSITEIVTGVESITAQRSHFAVTEAAYQGELKSLEKRAIQLLKTIHGSNVNRTI